MTRTDTSVALAVVAYLAAVASLLTMEAGLTVWLITIVTWILALVGSFVASWRRAIWALPSSLFALAFPVGLMLSFSGGGLS